MKSCIPFGRFLAPFFIACSSFLFTQASAQTTIIDPAGAGGFELGADFASNGWTLVNGTGIQNRWFLGTVPTLFTTRSAYVSDQATGTTHTYSASGALVHFYRDVTFPAGQTDITLSFQWYCAGESTFDYMQVSMGPTSIVPTAAVAAGSNPLLTPTIPGTTVIGGFNLQGTALQTFSLKLPSALIGNCTNAVTARLFFTWRNDASAFNNPPAAVDNISLVSVAPGAPMAGTYTVGPTGTYATLSAATADVNARGVSAPVILELQGTYTSATETFPITLAGQGSCSPMTAANTVTIRPAAGAPTLTIAGTNAGPTIDLNSGNWWRIDGRPGGTGTTKGLVISNSSTTGQAIRWINDASNNIVRYCTAQGVSTSTVQGVLFFSTALTNGNDNNLVDNCDVADGATKPANGIYAAGTTTTTASYNDNNTISNSNIFNFSGATTWGINLGSGNAGWTINGNSLYQTASTTVSGTFGGIQVSSTLSGAFTISNNFIGGSAPNCGGSALTLLASTTIFRGMNINTPSNSISTISGNTIANVNFTTTNTSTLHNGIFVGTGSFNVTGNTIGSTTVAGSITMSYGSTTQNTYVGISASSSTPSATTMSGNTIGGHTFLATSSAGTSLRGLWLQGTANYTITNNTIGGNLANSLNLNGNNSVIGMLVGGTNTTITDNTISNLSFTGTTATGAIVNGIAGGSSGIYTVSNNTISKLSNASANVGTGASAGVIGMIVGGASTGGTTVSQNTISELTSPAATTAMTLTGILVNSTSTTGSNIIERNLVHSFGSASTGAVVMNGIVGISTGAFTFRNNMVRLGIDAAGAGVAGDYVINGITETAGANNYYNNSVYLGGMVATAANNTFAFNSSVTVNVRNLLNNIFFNARSSTAGAGKNYAIQVGGTAANPAGLTSNYNLLLANGTGGTIGRFNALDQATLADWRTATGQDFGSISADPRYINATGATPDLHISATLATPVEGGGQGIPSVTDDYDGQLRAGLTPVDIGADAGNFIAMDISAPGITYTPIPNNCGTGDVTISGVNITDATGIPLAGALAPRIYFRKGAGAWASRAGTFVSGTATNSNWNFTMVMADLGGVTGADVISYYIIAQDNAAPINIGSNPGGVVATNVNTVTTHPAAPNTFIVLVPLAGTYSVGPAGNFATITAAANAVVLYGVSAPVIFELNAAYTSTTETFPIVLGATSACGNPMTAANNVTIRPAAGAPVLSITGGNAGATVDFVGGNWWRIDGRPGGTGTTQGLTISNTSTTGQALRFINEGSNNIVRYCALQGVNTSTTSGVVLFSTTTGTSGNDNNLIDNCNIGDGATTPANCIYSLGTSTSQAQYNSNNTVSNCNIFNFFLSSSTSFGIQLTTGSTDWTVTANSFYQTASRTIASTFAAINCASTISNNFVITNNFIGGSAPQCGGGALTLLGTGNLRGINMTVGPSTSLVQGNTVRNINYTTTNATNFNGAILLGQGNFNCNNNTVGSLTNANDIVVSASGTTFVFIGIGMGGTSPTNTSTISNNSVGGISLTVTGTPASPGSIQGIRIQGTVAAAPPHNYIVTGNTVGSTTVANSITADGNLTGSVIGIFSFSNALGQQITNNTVANLTAPNAGTSNILWGILTQGNANVGSYTITGNTVRNLTSGSGATGTGGAASILAVQISINLATSGTNVVSQNTIHSLLNNNPTAATSVTGLVISVPTVTSNTVARNLLHSMNMTSSALTGFATGIQLNAGTANVQNNMVRLGLDAAGADITAGNGFVGIREAGGNHNVHFNSVYIGGSGVSSGSTNTFAFSSLTTAGTRNYVSNIFYNARSNGAGTGKHYATSVAGTVANPAGVLSNYNNLFATGTGGFVGLFNAADQATLANWRTATGLDFNSVSANPNFVAPNGNAATLDLHIQPGVANAIESGGQPVPSATDDYDGQTRSTLTPTDIGADAGNFPLADVSGPGIAFTPLTGACGTGNIALNGVTITDGTGIPLTGGLVPRIYYQKNAGTWFSSPGTQVSGNALNSVWNFTINVANLGGVAATDLVGYYVIAQDVAATPNIGSNFGGVVATNVNTVTTHPVTPNVVSVQPSLSGTYTVGASGAFATLTAAAAAYNAGCLGGPVVFSLIDDTYSTNETFPVTFNQVFGASAVNTLTIRPAAGKNPVVTGSPATSLIKLNGADFVTIDGSNNGTNSRNLTFSNTNTAASSAVLWNAAIGGGGNGANNNTFKNLIVAGGDGTVATIYGIVSSSTGATTTGGDDNDNFRVENCAISKVYNGISILGTSLLFPHDGLVLTQNVIGSNTVANYVTNRGIEVNNAVNPIISQNTIFNIITPAANTNSTTGIDIGVGVVDGQVVRNNISAVYQPNTSGWNAYGIHVSGSTSTSPSNVLIANNFISDIKTVNYLNTSSFNAFGIRLSGGYNIKIYNNSIHLFGDVVGGTFGPGMSANIYVGSTLVYGLDLRNNILSNTQNFTNGPGGLAYNVYYGVTGVVVGTSNFNVYYGAATTTTTPRVGFDGAVQRITLAEWRTFTGQDQASISVAPVFVSNTDLHLSGAANNCLDGGGTPLAAVPADYDNEARNATTPDIGADEFTLSDISVAETSGAANNDGVTCAGAAVTLTAAGAGTYVWSTGATTAAINVNPTTTTTYTVTVTNSGCSDVFSTTVTVNPLPNVGISVSETSGAANNDGIICNGASVTLTASGGATYLWSNNATTAAITVNPTATTTYTVTVTTANSCSGTASVTITVNAVPTPGISVAETSGTTPNDGITCAGATATLTATGGTSYQWSTGGNTAAISVNPTATTTYTVTVTNANACTATATQVITVNALPTPAIAPPGTTICNGVPVLLTASGGGTYTWTTAQTTAAITVTPAATTTYTVTVTNANACSASASATVNVNPTPTLSATKVEPTTCISTDGSIDLTVGGSGTFTYNWSGAGIQQGQQDQSNLTVGSYFVTVTNSGTGCTSTLAQPLIGPGGCDVCPTIGALAAPTGVCNGSAATLTASPLADMGITYGIQFKYSPTMLANPYTGGTVIATIPNGGLAGGGTSAATSFTFPATGAYFVYAILSPAPIDPACRPSKSATVNVNPVPAVNAVTNRVHCPGNSVASIVFSGNTPGAVYTWTRTGEAIGLAATSGAGSVPAFTAANATNAPLTSTFTVTPSFTANGVTCTGASTTFTITVNPTPTVADPTDQVVCNAASTTAVNFVGTVNGTVYNWTNNNTSIGLAASGSGDIAAFTATNTGIAPVTATITVTPSYTNGGVTCTGAVQSFTIIVNPTPTVNAVASQTRCNGASTAAINFTGAVGSTVYNWTNNNISIGLAASGSGNIPAFIATNTGTAPVTATITVTPSYTNAGTTCTGTPITFTITVNPIPAVNAVSSQVYCSGSPVTPPAFGSNVTGATFTWTNSNTAIGLAASGSGNLPTFTPTNAGGAAITGTITVTPNFAGCVGTAITFTITVSPTPTVNAIANQLLCSESNTTAVTFTGTPAGTVFNWTNNTPAIGLAASGTGDIPSFAAQNPGTTPLVATITVTPAFTDGGTTCFGTPRTFTITVNPLPKVNVGPDQVICQDQTALLTALLSGGATSGSWSGGTGIYGNKNAASTTYLPAASEYGQTITLTFTSNDPAGPCPATSDALNLTINKLPLVNIGFTDFLICEDSPLTLADLNAGIVDNGSGVTTGTWVSSGTGTFQPNANYPSALTYTPSAADIAAGFIILRLTSADPAGPCGTVFDEVRIGFHEEDQLTCNDLVHVSLDASCVGTISPDDMLEGDQDDYKFYTVKLYTLAGAPLPGNNVVGVSDLGKTYKVKVTDICSGNFCWGNIKVEDKLAPKLTCADVTLICAVQDYTPGYITNVLGIAAGTPTATDCSTITMTYDDVFTDLPCGGIINGKNNVSAYIKRDWLVKDAWNNFAVCTQYIYLERRGITTVKFPADVDLNCTTTTNTSPSSTGAPFVTDFGRNWPLFPDVANCELSVGHQDQILPVCGNSYKILRTWTVYDWCLPTNPGPTGTLNPQYFIQVIKVTDNQAPTMTCPTALTVSTDPYNCCSTANLPDLVISDNCNKVASIMAIIEGADPLTNVPFSHTIQGSLTTFEGNNLWNPDTLGVLGNTPCLPLGTYPARYIAEDLCGNQRTCSFNLTVADLTQPNVACDQPTKVSLGNDGTTQVLALTFDDGSYDNCGPVTFGAGRSSGANAPTVQFTCTDIGKTITVFLTVTDQAGNTNECMVQVYVEDKLKPTCESPANVTVSCENFDPSLWAYGFATSVDNCCVDTITTTTNLTQFDTLCNRGTITRTFRAFDCGGNSQQCTQRILVNYEQDYFVRFPDDRIVTVCDGTGNYGEPTFLNKDCELLGVSFTDEVFTVVPDACFKIERTWHVINWCRYNANIPLTDVPNPNPNATVNSPANNAGPVISSSSNPNVVAAPWTATRVAIVPGAAQTDYSVFYTGGTYTFNGQTITVPSISNSNGFSYKQIIKVLDTQDPVIENCPASPVTFCDLTPNDGSLWNESYWWDNGTMSHDLCEGPTDLTITATDACSGAGINIKYVLFLDTDNNGTMETVISSTNLPGWNTVNFNNAQNPNFTGGVPQAFDQRPVPSNQKWGFALQTTVSGTKKTAAVRWNTFQAQGTYVVPELPYGTHKIKWVVEDGCGNESICEYTFIVKDCKAPTVVCKNGLSVNIMPTGMIQLWASDFLQYTEDNCTPANKLQVAIRRVGVADGQGNTTGFPRNADGTPQTTVNFTCADLGQKEVELWSIDLAGNADFCQTYVIIQDNAGNCTTTAATVAGYLKTEDQKGLEDAHVEISGSGAGTPPFVKTVITDNSGYYQSPKAVPFGANFTVTPVHDVNPLNGVSTYDLVLISKHILGLEPLSSPYKMIAADANKSGSITTFDIVEIRKLILGIYVELPNNTSWRFLDKSFQFPDPLNPFKTAFPENKSVADIQSHLLDNDFVAMKIGDVNGSATANSLMASEDRTAGTLLFDVEDRTVKAGEEFEVSFKAAAASQGYQMTLNLNGLTVADIVESGRVTAANFGVHTDALTVSIDGTQEFTVKFRAAKSGRLSEMLGVSGRITKAEAYSLNNERQAIALRFNGSVIAGLGFELYQNQPNPFVNKTFIGFHLPEATTATLTVFDEMGRTLFIQKGDFAKGYNSVTLERALLDAPGALYYRLETATDTATKQMIQVK